MTDPPLPPPSTNIDATIMLDTSTIVADIGQQLLIGEKETAAIDLFSALERNEECPVCLMLMPLYLREHIFCHVCGNSTCLSCDEKNKIAGNRIACSLCRGDLAKSKSEHDKNYKHGVLQLYSKRHMPEAAIQIADHLRSGKDGFAENIALSLHYYLQAAKMGNPEGYTSLGDAYGYGIRDILERDMGKCVRYLEVAAKKGSATAHERLWKLFDNNFGASREKAVEHARVLAEAGCSASVNYLFHQLKEGNIAKDELTKILIAHKDKMDC